MLLYNLCYISIELKFEYDIIDNSKFYHGVVGRTYII